MRRLAIVMTRPTCPWCLDLDADESDETLCAEHRAEFLADGDES